MVRVRVRVKVRVHCGGKALIFRRGWKLSHNSHVWRLEVSALVVYFMTLLQLGC
jgi:hypothetical protein